MIAPKLVNRLLLCTLAHILIPALCPNQSRAQIPEASIHPDVKIECGGTSQRIRDQYGDVSSIIVTAINEYVAGIADSLSTVNSSLASRLTDRGAAALTRFLLANRIIFDISGGTAFVKPCIVDNYINGFREVGGIAVHLVSANSPTNRNRQWYIVLGFNRDNPPSLEDIRFDEVNPPLDLVELSPSSRLNGVFEEQIQRLQDAYNDRDMDYLKRVYHEDAVIRVGKKLRRSAASVLEFELKKMNKKMYLSSLQERVFDKANDLRIELRPLHYQKSGENDNVYLATIRQKWWSDIYQDEGTLFLTFELDGSETGIIVIRRWIDATYDATDNIDKSTNTLP